MTSRLLEWAHIELALVVKANIQIKVLVDIIADRDRLIVVRSVFNLLTGLLLLLRTLSLPDGLQLL